MLASAPYVVMTGAVLPAVVPTPERLIVIVVGVVLIACGLACRQVPQRFPDRFWLAAPFIAVLLITGLNVVTSDASTGSQLFFLWPVLYATLYLSRRAVFAVLGAVFAGEATNVFVVFDDPGRAWADLTAMILALSMSTMVAMTLRERANRLVEALRDQALADPLTGLANRRCFDLELAAADLWVQRGGGPLALLSLDLDRFKAVNDTWGHAAGDLAPQAVADAMRAVAREGDVVARLGGDEFVMLLRTDRPGALRVGDALRRAVAAGTGVPGGPPGVSIGLAVLPGDADTVEALRTASDAALYDAKFAGRGRVMTADTTAPSPHHVPAPDLPDPAALGAGTHV